MSQKVFKEFSTVVRVDENSVWFYFLRDKENQLAKCKKCDKEVKHMVAVPVNSIRI